MGLKSPVYFVPIRPGREECSFTTTSGSCRNKSETTGAAAAAAAAAGKAGRARQWLIYGRGPHPSSRSDPRHRPKTGERVKGTTLIRPHVMHDARSCSFVRARTVLNEERLLRLMSPWGAWSEKPAMMQSSLLLTIRGRRPRGSVSCGEARLLPLCLPAGKRLAYTKSLWISTKDTGSRSSSV